MTPLPPGSSNNSTIGTIPRTTLPMKALQTIDKLSNFTNDSLLPKLKQQEKFKEMSEADRRKYIIEAEGEVHAM